MKSSALFLTALSTILFAASPVFAQTMEPAKLWEVGDKATYTWTLFSKSEQIEEEVVGVSKLPRRKRRGFQNLKT